MKNKKLNGTETEVTTAEFNRYFNENYPYISHSLSNKQVEKWLNQDVIKRVSLSKKADYFQDYILSQGLQDDVEMMAGGNTEGNLYKPKVYGFIEVSIKLYKLWIELSNSQVEKIGEKLRWLKDIETNYEGIQSIVYYGDKDGNQYVGNDGILVSEKNLLKVQETLEELNLDRVTKITESTGTTYVKDNNKKVDLVSNINKTDKKMAGGSIDNENKLMVANNNKQLRHHTEELENALQNAKHIPAWVVSLVGRATQDISDVTHYLDGTTQYSLGGGIEKLTEEQRKAIEVAKKYGYVFESIDVKDGIFRALITKDNGDGTKYADYIYPDGTDYQGLDMDRSLQGWWIDPAGGLHAPDEDDPSAMYMEKGSNVKGKNNDWLNFKKEFAGASDERALEMLKNKYGKYINGEDFSGDYGNNVLLKKIHERFNKLEEKGLIEQFGEWEDFTFIIKEPRVYYSVELDSSEDQDYEFDSKSEAFSFARKKEREGYTITDVAKYVENFDTRSYNREADLLDAFNTYSFNLRLSSGNTGRSSGGSWNINPNPFKWENGGEIQSGDQFNYEIGGL